MWQDGAGTCEHYVKWEVYVPALLLYTFQKATYLVRKAPYSPCVTFLFTTKAIFTLNVCIDYKVLVSTAYQVRDTCHTRSHTNVECFSLWQNPNKSYALLLTWYKKKSCCFQTTLARLFHPLIVSIKGNTMSYPRHMVFRRLDWTSKTRTSKVWTSKTRTSKTRTSKTRTRKRQTSKMRTSKRQTGKTRTSKTRTLTYLDFLSKSKNISVFHTFFQSLAFSHTRFHCKKGSFSFQ